ncbi:MAG: extracellular solute-binding protein [Lachnospiraceae bacterium]|nr:extracellular solute-binding protein [Lachnospiraceae bacterium]
MIKNRLWKRMTAVLLAGSMVCLLAACGKGNENGGESSGNGENSGSVAGDNGGGSGTQNAGGQTDDVETLVPRFYDLLTDAEADSTAYSSVSFVGDRLYYIYSVYKEGEKSSGWYYVDAANPEAGPIAVLDLTQYETRGEDLETGVAKAAVSGEDGIVLLLRTQPPVSRDASEEEYARQRRETTYSVKKLAADGTEVFDIDITEYLYMGTGSMADLQIFTDQEGAVYVSDNTSYVWMFDKEGNHTADIALPGMQGFAVAVNILPDGRPGVIYQGNSMQIAAYNPDTRQFSDTYTNLPSNCSSDLGRGPNGGVLLNKNGTLYEYSMAEKEYKQLIKWADCGVNEEYIRQVTALTDGRIAVYSSDWSTNTNTLILMEGVVVPKTAAKEVLTLACMNYASPFLRAAVVEFNKTSAHYKIEIKMYDGRTPLYNDILTGNAPDMFVASDIDTSLFVVKGLLEDLSPYLDSSKVVQREDLFETMLNAYTVDNILCAIPVRATIRSLAGRTSEVGTESGWTLAEMIAFAEAHPETQILPSATKTSVLNTCLLYDFDSWANWETGECFFDTPEFKMVMEFANRYPEQEEDTSPTQELQQVMAHKALLYTLQVQSLQDWQFTSVLFQEPITAIGYPSSVSSGVLIVGYDEVCISASSPNKEAAWSFIETLLTEEALESKDSGYGIPVRISTFEKELEEALEPHYLYDGSGEILLDEDGNPKQYANFGYYFGDIEIKVYALTEEEADSIRQVISRIDGRYEYNDALMEIIMEEIAPYFAGQKSVDEAADIIQNRAQLYMNESR